MENRILQIVSHNLTSKKNPKITRREFPHHATIIVIFTLFWKNGHNFIYFFWWSKVSGKSYSGDRFSLFSIEKTSKINYKNTHSTHYREYTVLVSSDNTSAPIVIEILNIVSLWTAVPDKKLKGTCQR